MLHKLNCWRGNCWRHLIWQKILISTKSLSEGCFAASWSPKELMYLAYGCPLPIKPNQILQYDPVFIILELVVGSHEQDTLSKKIDNPSRWWWWWQSKWDNVILFWLIKKFQIRICDFLIGSWISWTIYFIEKNLRSLWTTPHNPSRWWWWWQSKWDNVCVFFSAIVCRIHYFFKLHTVLLELVVMT